ncbi:alpha amylase, catalytic region [Novosphingobium nitrogenifigens DSM 19370]|uniref:Alpha amylase, catalytic region n=1 Tax=Novosphingobium nitrogenifigens DSM 19370 TaxID=983920 RepID=F1ZAZ7_9SPHN|nr:alpha-amylase family glycosyl hydrolase [Novosphingobium nitrogenifigens]EGD58226.1 alpha amylase, catalytic region [Novosphingobium nitrogenifigens DSM 19370]
MPANQPARTAGFGARARGLIARAAFAALALAPPQTGFAATTVPLAQRPAADEIVYFLLPDRFDNGDPANDTGGLMGDRLKTGFDPSDKGFYHGGDLVGVIRRLDYIQALGATAIWVGPIFRNRPVQGAPGHESAGYHGYWITDFTRVDPHFGTDADFARLVREAHARGIKVYMDIVVNHTADVIHYRECPDGNCPYRSRADYPYQRRGGIDGAPINPGFLGDAIGTEANFAHLTRPDYAYTPVIDPGEEKAKVPGWLNDPLIYHNRGNSTFAGESSTMGDFSGLDDVMTESPRVIRGMIAIYSDWITRYRIDGYRIDTAKHVDPAFWRAFIPAIRAVAKAHGIPHFAIFGEVAGDAGNAPNQARFTRIAAFPATLDFGFRRAVIDAVTGTGGTDRVEDMFAADALYAGGEKGAREEVTFVSNHDNGRIGWAIRQALPQAGDEEVLQRTILAHAMLLTLRGVPAIYAGDEQGFAGTGGDQDAREDQFGSHVASYNAEKLIGTTTTTATPHFATDHPIFRAIADLARIRRETPALRTGTQIIRARSTVPGIFAVSRIDPTDGHEVLIAYNTEKRSLSAAVEVDARSRSFHALAGPCPAKADAPGSVRLTLPALGYVICEAER